MSYRKLRKEDYREYLEKTYAAWLGKNIGIRLGAPVEGWNHSCVFQSQLRSFFCLARNSMGLDPSVMLVCSKCGSYLQAWLPPCLDREVLPRFTFYSWLHISRASREAC